MINISRAAMAYNTHKLYSKVVELIGYLTDLVFDTQADIVSEINQV